MPLEDDDWEGCGEEVAITWGVDIAGADCDGGGEGKNDLARAAR